MPPPPDYLSRPGTAAHAVSVPDGTQVTLDSMIVDQVIGCYSFLRDPWARGSTIPVYACAALQRWWTVEVSGTMTTISGVRVLVAHRIRVYTDREMRPCPPLPKGLEAPWTWPYMADVPLGTSFESVLPPPPASTLMDDSHEPLTAEPGTIAHAKINGGSVTLEGKIVTAVFRPVGSAVIDFFYIQEPDCPSGIKVDGACGSEVEAGDVVTVQGTVVGGTGLPECYIEATSVVCTGSSPVPKPLGMTNKATAGGQFGLQPALYLDSSDADMVGHGLNAVGTLIRVCGKVLRVEGQAYSVGDIIHYIDDGSGLRRTTPDGSRPGLKLLSWQGYSLPTYLREDYVAVTGILGAEMSVDNPARPVPVLLIPGPEKRNHIWVTPGNSIQAAIETANIQTPKAEVWVCAGTYRENILIHDGVAVYGGFIGSETKREQRRWEDNPTIIDGGGGTVVTFVEGATVSARVDGFTLCNGEAEVGAGVYCRPGASPAIANNIITGNTCGILGFGGGIYSSWGSPSIWNNWIKNNGDESLTGSCGGGIYCSSGIPAILCNRIEENFASFGGGIESHWGRCAIWNNRIRLNRAKMGGGIRSVEGFPAIACNSIEGNVAEVQGGGLYCIEDSAQIAGNTILANLSDFWGGGILIESNYGPEITNNLILGNAVTNPSIVFGGGGIAIHCQTRKVRVANNTFVGNSGGPGYGGAVLAQFYSDVTLTNNIFHQNTAAYGHSVARMDSAVCSINYCDAYPYLNAYCDTVPGEGCVSVDPLFCGGTAHPYRLQDTSPVRGIGAEPTSSNHIPMIDIECRPRPGTDGFTDMGAYEDSPDCP